MVKFDPDSDNKTLWKCWGCAVDNGGLCCWTTSIVSVIGVILLITLLALSVKDVDENEMAIPYDQVSRDLGDVIEAGKHVLTPAVKLFSYDRKFITNDLEIVCITKDGLGLQNLFLQVNVTDTPTKEKYIAYFAFLDSLQPSA